MNSTLPSAGAIMVLQPIIFERDGAEDTDGLDDAHSELFDLFNRIVWACENETAVLPVRERIRSFLMYAVWHFAREEECMQTLRYPDRVRHIADHARLKQDAEDFLSSLGNALVRSDMPAIARYFSHWLTRHTLNHDEPLRAFVKRARADAADRT